MTRDKHPRMTTVNLALIAMALLTALTLAALAGVIVTRRDAALSVARASYKQDIRNWHERLEGCGRTKSDRTSTARALRAQSTYLRLVLDAASVKEDVKTAARMTQRVFNVSASSLESRTGTGLICTVVYPKPPTPAGVRPLP